MRKLFFFLALLCSLSAFAGKDRYTRVYMFGVATQFTDSVVVMTDIIAVDSAFVNKYNMLSERVMYSYQLEAWLERVQKRAGATVAVFWTTDRRKIEKNFLKIRRRYLDDTTSRLLLLQPDEFVFKRVEHYND